MTMTITATYLHLGGRCIRLGFIAAQSPKTGHSNRALTPQTGHSSDDSKECPVSGNSAQLVRSFLQTGHCLDPHKQADARPSVPSSAQFLQHVDTTRAHINLTTTRAQETAQPENTALLGTASQNGDERQSPANAPRTFMASRRAHEQQRRWHVLRSPDDELGLIGASKPWGVFVDDADDQSDDILFVIAFHTHAAAIEFADRWARS